MTAQAHPSHRVSRAVTAIHALLDDISDVSLWSMGTDETAHTLTEITRAASRVAEPEARIASHADAVGVGERAGATSIANWWAHQTRMTRTEAHRKTRLADGLDQHPAVQEGLRAGDLLVDQARVIIRAVDDLPEHLEPELIGQTEVALTRNRSVDDLRHTLQSNLEEFERMRAIINDMLFLARADQGERATGLVEVSLAAEAAHTLEFLEIPLEEARVHAQLRGDAVARVNRSLFGRACANLLMNAIQHCEPGAQIDVTIVSEEDQVRVAVANPGAPIAPDVLEHLFDRFYRAEVSRTNSRENHGLGLAIVKAIAEMHRGTVSAQSAHGINTFAFSVAALPVEAGMRPVRANASAAAGSADYSSLVKGKSA